ALSSLVRYARDLVHQVVSFFSQRLSTQSHRIASHLLSSEPEDYENLPGDGVSPESWRTKRIWIPYCERAATKSISESHYTRRYVGLHGNRSGAGWIFY